MRCQAMVALYYRQIAIVSQEKLEISEAAMVPELRSVYLIMEMADFQKLKRYFCVKVCQGSVVTNRETRNNAAVFLSSSKSL